MFFGTCGCLMTLLCCASVSNLPLTAGNYLQTAELKVIGQLLENAYYLDTSSKHQALDLDLGNLSITGLMQIGEQGRPVILELKLHRCVRVPFVPASM